jgi:hypothetical protein
MGSRNAGGAFDKQAPPVHPRVTDDAGKDNGRRGWFFQENAIVKKTRDAKQFFSLLLHGRSKCQRCTDGR